MSTTNPTKRVKQWIEQSVRYNQTVRLDRSDDVTAEEIEALQCEADDSVHNSGVDEFWGTTDEGHSWSVDMRIA